MNKLLLGLTVLVLGFGCAKESNSNNTTATTNAYQLNTSGQCVQTSTGQFVQANYCQQNQTGQQCYGNYSYNGHIYACGIQYNCSGYTVINVQTGQSVYCQ
jgi:hypothetical protein